MPTDIDPLVGAWYRHREKGQEFEVVALDEDDRTVEIQHFDGDLEEIPLDAWYEMEVEPFDPPEDWTAPFDDVEHDDLGYSETDMEERDWADGLAERALDPERDDAEEDTPLGEAVRDAFAGTEAPPEPDELGDETTVAVEEAPANALAPAQLLGLERALEARFREVRTAAGAALAGARDTRSTALAARLRDAPDEAVIALLGEADAAIVGAERRELVELDAALGRVADGSYGICARCEAPIGFERLRASPATPWCEACEA